jgi:hypothetical protein
MDFHYHRGGIYRLVENELDWEIMTGVVKNLGGARAASEDVVSKRDSRT